MSATSRDRQPTLLVSAAVTIVLLGVIGVVLAFAWILTR
jgi:flagellar biogenesis protein FliO